MGKNFDVAVRWHADDQPAVETVVKTEASNSIVAMRVARRTIRNKMPRAVIESSAIVYPDPEIEAEAVRREAVAAEVARQRQLEVAAREREATAAARQRQLQLEAAGRERDAAEATRQRQEEARAGALAKEAAAAAAFRQRVTVAFGWNIVVIVIGALVALIGIFAWLFADTGDSALHQTVAALWLLAGILGILISAVGILGATLAYALRYDP